MLSGLKLYFAAPSPSGNPGFSFLDYTPLPATSQRNLCKGKYSNAYERSSWIDSGIASEVSRPDGADIPLVSEGEKEKLKLESRNSKTRNSKLEIRIQTFDWTSQRMRGGLMRAQRRSRILGTLPLAGTRPARPRDTP